VRSSTRSSRSDAPIASIVSAAASCRSGGKLAELIGVDALRDADDLADRQGNRSGTHPHGDEPRHCRALAADQQGDIDDRAPAHRE